jgi:hypothetical protein
MNGGIDLRRTLMLFVLSTVFGSFAAAQEVELDEPIETEATEVTEAPSAADEPVEPVEPDEAAEPVVDDEYYQDVDDEDFRPSEDIPADQSISFPTDI